MWIFLHVRKVERSFLKIVIVDDEKDFCFLLSGLLRRRGYEVISFNTLSAAMQGISYFKPNWVILDNNFPEGLGWERIDEILRISPDVKMIKISANSDASNNRQTDTIRYLAKPLEVNSILDIIEERNDTDCKY